MILARAGALGSQETRDLNLKRLLMVVAAISSLGSCLIVLGVWAGDQQ